MLFTITLMFYFQKCLGKQYLPWICTQLAQTQCISIFFFKFLKNKRSADSNHAMYHLLSIVCLPVMCHWHFFVHFYWSGFLFSILFTIKSTYYLLQNFISCWCAASNIDVAILIWIHILICHHFNMNPHFNLLQNMLKNL